MDEPQLISEEMKGEGGKKKEGGGGGRWRREVVEGGGGGRWRREVVEGGGGGRWRREVEEGGGGGRGMEGKGNGGKVKEQNVQGMFTYTFLQLTWFEEVDNLVKYGHQDYGDQSKVPPDDKHDGHTDGSSQQSNP